ncbi:MTR10 [Mytilus edulis]|uniref:TRPO3 n=1 Tax=Mytilus edulis TaxID=6550 RepID=A0A8S3TV76_MYTED|nr:MTR10 [Mytilus edulis]
MSVALDDTDKSINYCRIFTELAESFLEQIVNTPNQGFTGDLGILDLLLTCVGHHLYEVAEITFNVWYRLSEELYQRHEDPAIETFKPYIQRLIVAMCRHCQMDQDHDGIPGESDDFGEFRVRVSELIKDVIFIVGSSNCFAQMYENLKQQTESTSWDVTEATLFIMTAVAKNILPEENEIVPEVVKAILSIPPTAHIAVRYTNPILQFLLAGLQESKLASAAATSVQSISTTCKGKMRDHFQGLLNIAQAIDTLHLSNEAIIGFLKGTAVILTQLPVEKVGEALTQLCSFQITPLSSLLTKSEDHKLPSHIAHGSKEDPTVWLDRLSAIFRHTTPVITNGQVHPCQTAVQQVGLSTYSLLTVNGYRLYPPPSNISPGGRSTAKLSDQAKSVLKSWWSENSQNPYPTQATREEIANRAGLTHYQYVPSCNLQHIEVEEYYVDVDLEMSDVKFDTEPDI